MKKFLLILVLLTVPVLVCGCRADIIGKFDDYNELITGTIDLNMEGQGYIEAVSEPSGIKCKGMGQITYVPAGSATLGMCKGQRGIAEITCDDGRRISGEWECNTCTEIEGTALSNSNESLTFFISTRDKKISERRKLYVSQIKDKPPLNRKSVSRNKIYSDNFNIKDLF